MPTTSLDPHQLAYLDQAGPSEAPTLLLGHSYLWDHRMWEPCLQRWRGRYRCVATDLPAHGDSSPTTADLDELAELHLRLLDELGIDRCVVVGLSIGGMWGLRLAARHPERVAGLVLANTSAQPEPAAARERYDGMFAGIEQAGCIPAALREQVVPGFFALATRSERPELVSGFDAALANLPDEQLAPAVAIGRHLFHRDDATDACRSIRCPTLVIAGREDVYRSLAESEHLAAQIPDAGLEVLDGAGHLSCLDRPAEFCAVVERFVDGL